MGSGAGTSEDLVRPTVRRMPFKKSTAPASAKMSEVGVNYGPQSGMSPAAAKAITGDDAAAAKLAGRDISVAQLGNLQSRANVGQLPFSALNIIGKRRAKTILDTLIEGGTPETGQRGFIQGVADVTPRVTPRVTPERVPASLDAVDYDTMPYFESSRSPNVDQAAVDAREFLMKNAKRNETAASFALKRVKKNVKKGVQRRDRNLLGRGEDMPDLARLLK